MLISTNEAISKIKDYLYAELINQMPVNDAKSFFSKIAVEMAMRNIQNIAEKASENELFKKFILENEKINTENLISVLRENITENGMNLEVPIIGKIKIDSTDIEKLRTYLER